MIIRSKEQWLNLFQQHESSGLSAAQFCRDKKLCARYFSKRKKDFGWNSQFNKEVKLKKKSSDFIKVSVSKPAVGFSLEYGGIKLSWNELPPTDWLSELMKSFK